MNKLRKTSFLKKNERKIDKIKHLFNDVFAEIRKKSLEISDELKNDYIKMEEFFSDIKINCLITLLEKIEEEDSRKKEKLSQEDIKNIKLLLTEYHTPKKKICEKYKISFKTLQHYLTRNGEK